MKKKSKEEIEQILDNPLSDELKKEILNSMLINFDIEDSEKWKYGI